jgi:hypothetical protein
MRVLLQRITQDAEKGGVRLAVQFGDEPTKEFIGDYDGSDAKYKFCNFEEELFMRLSELAMKRYANCAVYQMELMAIIGAFVSGQRIPAFPIELGTTSFGTHRPSSAKIFFNRIRRPIMRAWLTWKLRHVRRENLLKYGKAADKRA